MISALADGLAPAGISAAAHRIWRQADCVRAIMGFVVSPFRGLELLNQRQSAVQTLCGLCVPLRQNLRRGARATFWGNQPATVLRRCGRRALSIASIMRASSKARGEAKAISCVRSYSRRSSIHSRGVSFRFTSGRCGFAATGSNAVAMRATAILAVGLPEVRRAEAQKISQSATEVFVLNGEKFFAGQQAAFRFHGRASAESRFKTKS